MKQEPSLELEAYFELCKDIYLRLEREGRLDELLALKEQCEAKEAAKDIS